MIRGRRMRMLRKLLLRLGDIESRCAVVEIGVHRGHLSEYLLHIFPRLHLTMVDPWDPKLSVGYEQIAHSDSPRSTNQVNRYHIEALRRTRPYSSRRTIIRHLSVNASLQCQEQCYDLVFIDADHSYRGVKTDIAHWHRKVKPGGILCGHDYGEQFEGVARAVDEWGDEAGKTITTGKATVWWTLM